MEVRIWVGLENFRRGERSLEAVGGARGEVVGGRRRERKWWCTKSRAAGNPCKLCVNEDSKGGMERTNVDLVNGSDDGARDGCECVLVQNRIPQWCCGLHSLNVSPLSLDALFAKLTLLFHLINPAPAVPSIALISFFLPPTPPTRCPYALSLAVFFPSSSFPTSTASSRLPAIPQLFATAASDLGPAYMVNAALVTRVGR